MNNCPKCGFQRKEGDNECPNCGVIYEKYETYIAKKREKPDEPIKNQASHQKEAKNTTSVNILIELKNIFTKERSSWMPWKHELILVIAIMFLGLIPMILFWISEKNISLSVFLLGWGGCFLFLFVLVYFIRLKTYFFSGEAEKNHDDYYSKLEKEKKRRDSSKTT